MKSRTIAAIAAAGITAATLGVGGVAMADASPTAPPVSPSATATTNPGATGHRHGRQGGHHGVHHKAGHLAGRALHAQWVTRDGKAFVTHDAIRGQVTDVSKTAITVKAQDGTQETYAVTGATKVRMRMAGKAAPQARPGLAKPGKDKPGKAQPSSVSAIHVGDRVAVVGTGTSSLKATRIVTGLKTLKSAPSPQAS